MSDECGYNWSAGGCAVHICIKHPSHIATLLEASHQCSCGVITVREEEAEN